MKKTTLSYCFIFLGIWILSGAVINWEVTAQEIWQEGVEKVVTLDSLMEDSAATSSHPPFVFEENLGIPFLMPEEEVEKVIEELAPARSDNLRQNRSVEQTLLFYVFSFILLLYGFVRWKFEALLYIGPRILGNVRMMENYYEEPLSQSLLPRILLTINTFLIFGLLAFFALRFFIVEQVGIPTWELLLIGLGVVLIFLLVKMGIQWILSLALPEKRPVELYLFNRRYIHWLMGLVLLPLMILLSFTGMIPQSWLLLLSGFAILLLVFWQYIRGFQLGQHLLKLYPFHFFLYFCTLEIAPVLIVWGLINRFS